MSRAVICRSAIAGCVVAVAGLASPALACLTPGAAGCTCESVMDPSGMSFTATQVTSDPVQTASPDFVAARLEANAATNTTVHVFNFDFSTNASGGGIVDPTIFVGDSITWHWDSGFHSATSVAGSAEAFNSGDLSSPSGTFTHTFTHAGTFIYYCDIHGADLGNGTAGGMFGSITVLAVPEPTSLMAIAASGLLLRRRR